MTERREEGPPTKKENLEQEIKRLRSELSSSKSSEAEYRKMAMERREENDRKNKTMERLAGARVAIAEGLLAERMELSSRILRIDLRIRALGFANVTGIEPMHAIIAEPSHAK